MTTRPKLREIFAADFRDRIVHHLLVGTLEPDWERIFIHDSYACRTGKGVHKAVDRLQSFLLRATANGTRPAWYLQLDVHNYFMSMDKDVLWRLLGPRIHDANVAWLTRLLVYHDCTRDYVYKGRPGLLARVPPHKSLLQCPPGKGLPIGNLNSQFFANVYLNSLDQFVKHDLKCRHYLRYCDDFVLVSRDPDELRAWRGAIAAFLAERLLLRLNDQRERLRPVADGVDFLGYVVRPHYRLARRRVVSRMHERLAAFERGMVGKTEAHERVLSREPSRVQTDAGDARRALRLRSGSAVAPTRAFQPRSPAGAPRASASVGEAYLAAVFELHTGERSGTGPALPAPSASGGATARTRATPVLRLTLDPAWVAELQATLASYLGHLRWADTRRLTATLAARYPFLGQHLVLDPGARRLTRRLPARCPGRTVRAQYAWWRRQFAQDAVFFPVGRYVELYQGRDRPLAEALGLRRMQANRRGALWGFPLAALPRYLATALAAGWSVTVLRQEPLRGGMARREPLARHVPRPPA